MQLTGDTLLFSATDLINFLECEHLTWLDLERAQGRFDAEPKRPDTADLVARKGEEHERRHLEALRAKHGAAARRDRDRARARRSRAGGAADDRGDARRRPGDLPGDALRRRLARPRGLPRARGAPVRPRRLGATRWSTPSSRARSSRTSSSSSASTRSCSQQVQGDGPEQIHVLLGTGERKSSRSPTSPPTTAACARQFEAELADGLERHLSRSGPPLRPVPLVGRLRRASRSRRPPEPGRAHRRGRRPRSSANAGITTVAELGRARGRRTPRRRSARSAFERLRQQARLQVAPARHGRRRATSCSSPSSTRTKARRGFALLPRPSEGDVFFDIEGDPFYEDGLEYLWGVSLPRRRRGALHAPSGAATAREEKQAFEAFIDFVIERRERYPDLHVYHYAPYEPTALKRLMGLHATREDEVDQLLRQNVLVDLYRVVEQALRISQPSYSIKKVEAFYMAAREAAVTDGEDSILKFEEWLETRRPGAARRDRATTTTRTATRRCCCATGCSSAAPSASASTASRSRGARPARPSRPTRKLEAERGGRRAAATRCSPACPTTRPSAPTTSTRAGCWPSCSTTTAARPSRPGGSSSRASRSPRRSSRPRDSEALAGLEPTGEPRAAPARRTSLIHTLSFPAQEHKIGRAAFADPFTAPARPRDRRARPVQRRPSSTSSGCSTTRA